MLRSLKECLGYTIHAIDGDIGKVSDFYVEPESWTVRYLVADTGKWLPGQQVLIYHDALQQPDWFKQIFQVNLTCEQIENSPPIEQDQPVSRKKEIELFRYYNWDPYWYYSAPAMLPTDMVEPVSPPPDLSSKPEVEEGDENKLGIRSFNEVKGYSIAATDGDIGYIEDWIVNDEEWVIRYWVANTRKWLPGRSVLLSPDWVEEINWGESKAHMNLTKEQIQNSPEFDPAKPINREYEYRLYDFYGRPVYWIEEDEVEQTEPHS